MRNVQWRQVYADLLGRLESIVDRATPTLCGLAACVDARMSLHDAQPLLEATEPVEAVKLASILRERAAFGIGGEIRFDWAGGPDWLDHRLQLHIELGGTGAHAARTLTVLGAPAVLALEMRSPEQLSVLDPNVLIAADAGAGPARELVPSRPNAVKVYIFEYVKDLALNGIVPPRSSRIIVRFDDPGLENDEAFDRVCLTLTPPAGAGIVSGFSAIGGGDLGGALTRARTLCARWFASGMSTVHLELAGYERPAYRDRVLAELKGSITSLGMSLSEFEALVPDCGLADGMTALGDRLGLRRVCVHADGWAASATLDDPALEYEALMTGCLVAATRASLGRTASPAAISPAAMFEESPALPSAYGAWRFAACAAPYVAQPATTVGLGDTFMAGCLLVLGGQRRSTPGARPARHRNSALTTG